MSQTAPNVRAQEEVGRKIERDIWLCSDFVSRACEVPGGVPPKFHHPLHKPAQKAQQICRVIATNLFPSESPGPN